ncbi:MAG TPA: hypothetical protein VGJ04_08595 [Pirellulales bacterium]|jgi:hypothetical protein
MTTPVISKSLAFPNLASLRDLLNLLASLRNLSNPFTSADDLRTAVELLLNFGATLGLDPNWLAWLQSIHDNPQLLAIVLAVGQYLESLFDLVQPPASISNTSRRGADVHPAVAIQWTNWLALISQIVQLLEQLRTTK